MRRVALLAPMRPELRPLRRLLALRAAPDVGPAGFRGALGALEVVAAVAGIGTRAAAAAAERLLDATAPERVVVVGIAGGVGPGARVGDLVVPERVLDLATGVAYRPSLLGVTPARGTLATCDALVADPERSAALARAGVIALDMETAAIAAVCERRGVAWSVFRALSDLAGAGPLDTDVLGLAGPDGRPSPRAVLRFLATRPWRLPRLLRLGLDARRAARSAAEAAVAALAAGRG